jgi:hypothetical protein
LPMFTTSAVNHCFLPSKGQLDGEVSTLVETRKPFWEDPLMGTFCPFHSDRRVDREKAEF